MEQNIKEVSIIEPSAKEYCNQRRYANMIWHQEYKQTTFPYSSGIARNEENVQ
jgi:hypothetical protein